MPRTSSKKCPYNLGGDRRITKWQPQTNANGVGSRFRQYALTKENTLFGNDSRPLRPNFKWQPQEMPKPGLNCDAYFYFTSCIRAPHAGRDAWPGIVRYERERRAHP